TYIGISGSEAFTTCDLSLSTSSILFNGTVDASLKLTKAGFPNAVLTGSQMRLTVTAPDAAQTVLGPFTTNAFGQVTEQAIGAIGSGIAFNQKGAWTIQATFAGSPDLVPCDSPPAILLVGTAAGYAVIVQGRIANLEGIESHNKTTNRIYRTLLDRGFADPNIFYYNYAIAQDANEDGVPDDQQAGIGVDATPDKAAIQTTIENLAVAVNANPAPVYIILVDHGGDNTFYLDGALTITPPELDSWVDQLEAGLSAEALLEPRILITGACYSGGFIDELSAPNRLVIASAAANEESYKGPLEPDGIRAGEYFLEELFQELGKGGTFETAFLLATVKTELFTRLGGTSTNTVNAFFDDAAQHPLLDDNGDGVGGN
ncbi:MAG TPA: C13 family peptidase, partial [Candidatus Glassbacteria bacterium]|nr:C13 family peptidase [Candidatus Glassbacteria bacterium]